MPFRPEHSLLNLNSDKMHTIDTRSMENLHGLWAVFSKTAELVENGKRLENLAWRLWNRETFCCCPDQTNPESLSPTSSQHDRDTPTHAIPATQDPAPTKVPDLAASYETVSSEECDHDDTEPSHHVSPPCVVRPELTRLESREGMRRGREKHITPGDLEKMVVSIKQKQSLEPLEPLPLLSLGSQFTPASVAASTPGPESVPAVTSTLTTAQSAQSAHSTDIQDAQMAMPLISDAPPSTADLISSKPQSTPSKAATESAAPIVVTSGSDRSLPHSDGGLGTATSSHSIVRGFVPGGAPSSYRSQTHLAAQPTPILKNSPRNRSSHTRKKGALFTLGGSSGEEESSLDSNMYKNSLSSVAEGLQQPANRKQASFKDDNLVTKVQDSPVFESDEEGDDDDDDLSSESVIDDDDEDSSDWEDEMGDDDRLEVDDRQLFQRVDSRPNLTSHRSLLTSLMHEGDRAKALQNAASRSTPAIRRSRASSPNGPSISSSPQQDSQLAANTRENARARPIMEPSTSNGQSSTLSPRATRRNMLTTELTESLRRELLWERKNRSSHNLTALKRRHTSNDIKDLKQYPEPVNLSAGPDPANLSNEFFDTGLGEFHSKGW